MGRGRYGEGLDDAGELPELLRDALALPRQQRHLGTGFLDDTPCLRAELVRLLSGFGDDGGALGPGSAQLVVRGALAAEDLLGDLLAEPPGALLGLGEAVARPLDRVGGVCLGVLSDACCVLFTG
jgi:hypothetical protein